MTEPSLRDYECSLGVCFYPAFRAAESTLFSSVTYLCVYKLIRSIVIPSRYTCNILWLILSVRNFLLVVILSVAQWIMRLGSGYMVG